jgi:hypothetical protein
VAYPAIDTPERTCRSNLARSWNCDSRLSSRLLSWLDPQILVEGKLIASARVQLMVIVPLTNVGAAFKENGMNPTLIQAELNLFLSVALMIEGIDYELMNFHTAALSQKK